MKPAVKQGDANACLRVEYLPLSVLKPATRNPKRHEIETLRASMDRFGYTAPLILDERSGRLVAGHGRLESLKRAKLAGQKPPDRIRVAGGEWFVPVMRGVAFADDREAEAYLLADNQTTILGGWNDDELQEIIASLGAQDALAGTGFEEIFAEAELEQDDPAPLIDRAAELQKKWKTARGQLWLIGKHRLLCGDITSGDDVRKLMNGKRACLFATDPPYLVQYDGTNHPHKWNHSAETKRRKNKDWSDKYSDVDSPEQGEPIRLVRGDGYRTRDHPRGSLVLLAREQTTEARRKCMRKTRRLRAPADHLGQRPAHIEPLLVHVAARAMLFWVDKEPQAEANRQGLPTERLVISNSQAW